MSSYSKLVSHPDRPLIQHLQAVDSISRQALRRKAIQADFATSEDLENWRSLLVYFHDFGKSTVFFQHKIIQAILRENPSKNGVDGEYVDSFYKIHDKHSIEEALADFPGLGSHAELGAFVLQANVKKDDVLLRLILLEIVKRHHGDLQNFDEAEFILAPDREDQLQRQWQHANLEDYALLTAPLGFSLPDKIEPLLRQYGDAGIAIDLDDLLPTENIKPYLLTLFLFSLLLAADKGDMMLLQNRGSIGEVFKFPLELIQQYKKSRFGFSSPKPIDLLREEAYQLVAKHIESSLESTFFSITLPTGLGKTLTAFNAAIRLQELLTAKNSERAETVVPRIIYCLPFTSVIDQNATILEEIFERSGLTDGYLAKHHYLSDWPEKKAKHEDLTDSEKEYFTEGWEYPFTITTFVQFLETIFSNRNRKLRKFHNLVNAIVILDEVQNIPAKYFETIEVMFSALHDYFGVRFIFVTATQPFLISNSQVVELTDPDLVRTKQFFTGMNRIDLDLSLWREGFLPLDDLRNRFQAHIEANPDKSFLFILNKVKSSQELFLFLKEKNPRALLVYLSAAVLPALRRGRIELIKNPPAGKQLIVVTTQVVEAGVDIDLDVVYRDLAPLDSVNQSAGRCNRNGVKGKGMVRLFASKEGTGIYDKVLVNITEAVLNKAIERLQNYTIPESEFYLLNEDYTEEIRSKIANDSAHSRIIKDMRNLHFKTVNDSVRLIDPQNYRYSVFIDHSDESNKIWRLFQEKLKIPDRWERKKELRKLRPRLLQHVVQFPEKVLPEDKKQEDRPIIYLGPEEYPICYDLEIGYGSLEVTPPNAAVSL